jgi:hypothetical protein
MSCQDRRSCHSNIKKVVVTTSLGRTFESVTKHGVPIGDGAHETTEIALIVCGQSFLVGVWVVITRELMRTNEDGGCQSHRMSIKQPLIWRETDLKSCLRTPVFAKYDRMLYCNQERYQIARSQANVNINDRQKVGMTMDNPNFFWPPFSEFPYIPMWDFFNRASSSRLSTLRSLLHSIGGSLHFSQARVIELVNPSALARTHSPTLPHPQDECASDTLWHDTIDFRVAASDGCWIARALMNATSSLVAFCGLPIRNVSGIIPEVLNSRMSLETRVWPVFMIITISSWAQWRR